MPEEEAIQKTEDRTFWDYIKTPGGAIIIVGFALMIVSSVFLPNWKVQMNGGVISGFLIILGGIILASTTAALKHMTPKLLLQDYNTTITPKDIYEAGNYTVFGEGGIYVNNFPVIRGREGTTIVPSTCLNPASNSIFAPVLYEIVPFDQLPGDAQVAIIKNKLKAPYRLCIASEEQFLKEEINIEYMQEIKKVDLVTYSQIFKAQNAQITHLAEAAGKGLKIGENWTASMSRMLETADRRNMKERVKNVLMRRKQEE